MKYGAISLPAAIGAFTFLALTVIVSNIYVGTFTHSFLDWVRAVILSVMVILGIVAAITGGIGKRRDDRPRMAIVGFGMGLGAIGFGVFMLLMNTV